MKQQQLVYTCVTCHLSLRQIPKSLELGTQSSNNQASRKRAEKAVQEQIQQCSIMAVILPLILCCRQDCFILLRGIVPAQVLVHPPHLDAPAAPEGEWHGRAGPAGGEQSGSQ